jgi:ankyrin repeat protein
MTALLWAADMGHLDVIQLLIETGADANLRDENGLTALLWASDRGHVDCVKALVRGGADLNSTDLVCYFASSCIFMVLLTVMLLS